MTGRLGGAYARAIAIAVHAAEDRLPALLEAVAPYAASAGEPWDYLEVLSILSAALAPEHREELAALWRQVPDHIHATPVYRLGLLRLGAAPVLEDLRHPVDYRDRASFELRNETLDAVLARPFPERFGGGWARDLYAVAMREVLYVVDRIVRGVVEP